MTCSRIGAAIALGLAACSGHPTHETRPPAAMPIVETDDLGSAAPTCPALGKPGKIVSSRVRAGAWAETQLAIAIDFDGNVALAQDAVGVAVRSPDGRTIFRFGFGTKVAFDAAGHLFVAGVFAQPTDFGLGVVAPGGDVDVFVAELDRGGQVIAAKVLGACGTDVEALAIDRATGGVAIAGATMGTIVLDARLSRVYAVDVAGRLAFDARGSLVIAGAIGATGFVEKIDSKGANSFSRSFPADVSIDVRALAIDSQDNIVFGGNFSGALDLFGTRVDERTLAGELHQDTFLAKLDANGDVVFVQPPGLPGRTLDAIAIGVSDAIVVGGADLGHRGFDRIATTIELSAFGAIVFDKSRFPASGYGETLALATDPCGAIYVGSIAVDEPPVAGAAIRSYLVELAP
jgi:hypothetical protein